MQFPLVLTPDDNGTLMVTCPLLPEVTSFGEDHDDALTHGRDAVEEAIAARMARWEDIAWPQRQDMVPACKENRAVALSIMVSLKASLYAACKAAGVSRAELARRLNWHREQVDRLFRLDHESKVEQIEAAFAALNLEADVEVEISPIVDRDGTRARG
ncbi:MAG: antitoxin HicB [Chthoniobacter sp.]|nr:antitoxin HicB [Chthoniobacter sp.]